ncbi:MAG: NfeD family protein [Candidatus Sumerlaeaceae bacterium]|nr:NfeD family protein [Candidatus Sumerlaeaceae bacterium]
MIIAFLAAGSAALPAANGSESFLGQTAEALTPLNPAGKVRFNGSVWNAESKVAIPQGATVTIIAVKSLLLHVEPALVLSPSLNPSIPRTETCFPS